MAIKVLAISQSLHEIQQPFPEGRFPSALSISRMARVKMSFTACKTRRKLRIPLSAKNKHQSYTLKMESLLCLGDTHRLVWITDSGTLLVATLDVPNHPLNQRTNKH